MSYINDWKAAKKTFESKTNKKKPSESFMGLFNKGTGIEAALKAADAAKTAPDLLKAIAKFNAAKKAYVPVLRKSVTDPKTVPVDAKATYKAALDALEAELNAIEENAAAVAASLAGSGKKDKVDAGDLQQKQIQTQAEAHYQLRVSALAEAKKITKAFEAKVKEAETVANGVRKVRDTAAANKNNKMLVTVQLNTAERFLDQIDEIVKSMKTTYDANLTNTSSIIFRSRSDFKLADKLAPDFAKTYKPKSAKAFAEGTDEAKVINGLMSEVRAKRDEVETAKVAIEAFSDKAVDPAIYVTRLNKAADNLNTLFLTIDRAAIKAEGIMIDTVPKVTTMALAGKAFQTVVERLKTMESDLVKQRKVGDDLSSQADNLPRGADDEPAVAKAAKAVKAKAGELETAAKRLTTAIKAARDGMKKKLAELQAAKEPA